VWSDGKKHETYRYSTIGTKNKLERDTMTLVTAATTTEGGGDDRVWHCCTVNPQNDLPLFPTHSRISTAALCLCCYHTSIVFTACRRTQKKSKLHAIVR
jgi:hypothetical protein